MKYSHNQLSLNSHRINTSYPRFILAILALDSMIYVAEVPEAGGGLCG